MQTATTEPAAVVDEILNLDAEQELRQVRKTYSALCKALPDTHVMFCRVIGLGFYRGAGTRQLPAYRAEVGDKVFEGDTLEEARNLAFAEVTRIRVDREWKKQEQFEDPERFPFEHQ